MALNVTVFKTRTITALLFAATMLLGFWWNAWSFLLLFSLIHFGCWWEFLKLLEKIHVTKFHTYTKLGFMAMGYSLLLWFCGAQFQIGSCYLKYNLPIPVSAAGFILVILGLYLQNSVKPFSFIAALGGLLYISLSCGMMIDLYGMNIEVEKSSTTFYTAVIFPMIILFSIWINDTMAYIVGSLIGKTPLSKISPKKTWEGTLGGMLLAIVVMGLIDLYVFGLKKNSDNFHWFVIPAIAAIAGTIGDLFESKIKRMAGAKDSGNFLPGHGGFLDRFDSLLFAVPAVWVYMKIALQ